MSVLITFSTFFDKILAWAFVTCYTTLHKLFQTFMFFHICGCSLVVKQEPSKLWSRVRFSSPAPNFILYSHNKL